MRITRHLRRWKKLLRFGYITNYINGRVRVQIQDEDNFITDEIPIIRTNASRDKTGDTIDSNTLVAVILDDINPLNGVCLGAVEVMPVDNSDKTFHQFTDGTIFEYDRKTHILTADVQGEIHSSSTKTVLEGDVYINGSVYVTKEVADKKGTMQGIRDIYNKHKNPNNGASAPIPQM